MFRANKKKAEVYGKSHIRKNDTVKVLAGKDRGKQGKVLRVIPAKGKAIVERVNFIKKHVKANPGKNQKGGVMERESPVQLSNLKVICPSCGEPTRIRAKVGDEGTTRACKKCDSELGS
jgi:ribosomal protein L24, bacterial/organelle